MFNKKLSVTIKNNVNEKDLLDALKNHFSRNVEILKVFVFDDNSAFIIEYNGIAVTKWEFKDVYDLIDCSILDIGYEDTKIVEIF